jgi:membrane associated rhomboid family serine protease
MTFVLVAVCVCVYSATQYTARQAQELAEGELQAAIAYLLEHPYLEPGPVLAERVDATHIEQRRESERTKRNRRGAPPIPKRVQERQKEQLDALVAKAFAGVADLPVQRWGFRATEFGPATLVTHVFFHERVLHLVGALLLLLILGFYLEGVWGGGLLCLLVVLASAASATVYAIGNSQLAAPLVGMSGVVAALLGAFLISFRSIWKQPVYAVVLLAGTLFLILPAHFGIEWSVAAGLERTAVLAENRGASHWATAGGFVFGLLAQLAIAFLGVGERVACKRAAGSAEFIANPALEKIVTTRSAGRLNEAYGALTELLRETPDDHDALLIMWDVALDYARPAEAAAAMLRAIRDEVKRNDASAAIEHWLDLSNRGLNADAEPTLLIRLALMLQQHEHTFAAVAALHQALEKSEGGDTAVVASRIARASRDLDAETAREAAWRALSSVDLELEERQSLESLLADIGPGIETAVSEAADVCLEVEPDHAKEAPVAAAAGARRRPEPEAWVDPELGGEAGAAGADSAEMLKTLEFEDLVQVGDRELEAETGAADYGRPTPIDFDVASRNIRSIVVTPVGLEPDGLHIESEGGARRRVPLEKLEAISVAAVGGLSEKPVLLIDLVMNWTSGGNETLKVIRFRGDRFDARNFTRDVSSPLDALRAFIAALLRDSGATPLPDEPSANGMPFASFDDLASYQRNVLGAEEDPLPGAD